MDYKSRNLEKGDKKKMMQNPKLKAFKNQIRQRTRSQKLTHLRYTHWLETTPQILQLRSAIYMSIGECQLHCQTPNINAIHNLFQYLQSLIHHSTSTMVVVVCEELLKYDVVGVLCRNVGGVAGDCLVSMLTVLFQCNQTRNLQQKDKESKMGPLDDVMWRLRDSCIEEVLGVCLGMLDYVGRDEQDLNRMNKVVQLANIFVNHLQDQQRTSKWVKKNPPSKRRTIKWLKTITSNISNLPIQVLYKYLNILAYLLDQIQHQEEQGNHQGNNNLNTQDADQDEDEEEEQEEEEQREGYYQEVWARRFKRNYDKMDMIGFLVGQVVDEVVRIDVCGYAGLKQVLTRICICIPLSQQNCHLVGYFLQSPTPESLPQILQLLHCSSYLCQNLQYQDIRNFLFEKCLPILQHSQTSPLLKNKTTSLQCINAILKTIYNVLINHQRGGWGDYYDILQDVCSDLVQVLQQWEGEGVGEVIELVVGRLLNVKDSHCKLRVIRVGASLMKWKQVSKQLKTKIRLYLKLYGMEWQEYRSWDSEDETDSKNSEGDDEQYWQ